MSFAKYVLVIFAIPCLAQVKPQLSAKSVLARIEKDGAKEVVKQLNTPNDKQWNFVVSRIDWGGSEWLAVADKLKQGADAGAAEDLDMAVARALVHNPNTVLEMAGETWKLDRVCGDYEIEEPDAKARKRKADVTLALKRVVTPKLQEKKRACLAAARGSK